MTGTRRRSTAKYVFSSDSESDEAVDRESAARRVVRDASREDNDDEQSASEDEEVPKKKRKTGVAAPKTKVNKGKGRQGKLAYFSDMPLDILAEICSHLDPLTLLYMARTTKNMRSLLMSKGSRHLWIAARRSVHLPDLEATDWSEPSYASLVYEKMCHACGKGRAMKVSYVLRRRYCKACQRAQLTTEQKMRKGGASVKLHRLAFACTLSTPYTLTDRYSADKAFYYCPDLYATSDTLCRLEDEEDHENCNSTESSTVESRFDRFVRERKHTKTFVLEDAQTIEKWLKQSASDRADDAAAARSARIKEIRQRLLDLDHDPRDVTSGVARSQLAYQPRHLTEQIWNRIKSELEACVERSRQNRLAAEAWARRDARKELIRPLFDEWSNAATEAEKRAVYFDDFVLLDGVEEFWEPEGVELDEPSWIASDGARKAAIQKHLGIVKKTYFLKLAKVLYYEGGILPPAIKDQLDAIAKETTGAPGDYTRDWHKLRHEKEMATDFDETSMDSLLSRFSSQFECGVCYSKTELYAYPDILSHILNKHQGSRAYHWRPTDWQDGEASWLSGPIRQMLVEAGLDDSASREDLDALGDIWECEGCDGTSWDSTAHQRVQVETDGMDYGEALDHAIEHHRYRGFKKFKIMT